MTDTQAAERIWTDGHDYWAHPTHKDDKTEYIRADLIEALEAENRRLREALHKIEAAPAWGYPDRWETTPAEVRQLARAALRSTEDSHDD